MSPERQPVHVSQMESVEDIEALLVPLYAAVHRHASDVDKVALLGKLGTQTEAALCRLAGRA